MGFPREEIDSQVIIYLELAPQNGKHEINGRQIGSYTVASDYRETKHGQNPHGPNQPLNNVLSPRVVVGLKSRCSEVAIQYKNYQGKHLVSTSLT